MQGLTGRIPWPAGVTLESKTVLAAPGDGDCLGHAIALALISSLRVRFWGLWRGTGGRWRSCGELGSLLYTKLPMNGRTTGRMPEPWALLTIAYMHRLRVTVLNVQDNCIETICIGGPQDPQARKIALVFRGDHYDAVANPSIADMDTICLATSFKPLSQQQQSHLRGGFTLRSNHGPTRRLEILRKARKKGTEDRLGDERHPKCLRKEITRMALRSRVS